MYQETLTILIVDDSPDKLELMAFMLRQTGYQVATAFDGRECLEIAHRLIPDLIISDVSMPGMNGIELCRRIRAEEKLSAVPVMLITALYRDTESVVEGLHAGADDYLEAPYEPMRFIAKVARLIERKRIEETIRKREESLARAQRVAHIGSWDWDLLTNTVSWSDEMYHIYGVSKDEFAPALEAALRFTHPDDLSKVNQSLKVALKEHTPLSIDFRIIRPDGRVRIVSGQSEVYSDEEGQAVRLVGTVQDITERKVAEELLRENQELSRSAFDHAAIGMALVSTDGRWLQVNSSLCKIVGYSEQELLAMTFQAITHPDDLAVDLNHLHQVLAGEISSYQMEKRYYHKLGHSVWVLLSVSLVRDAQGNPHYFISQIQDITERKRAEEALRVSEEQFRTMANSIPQLAWMANADGFIFWYNQRWHDYTGTTPEQMEGWGWQSVHDPELLPKVLEKWRGAIASGQQFEMEFPLRGVDGRFRVFLTRGQPLKDSQGRVVRWFGTNTDVDELKRAEEALRQSEERLKEAQRIAQIGSWELDIATRTVYCSETLFHMLGFDPQQGDLDYETMMALYHPDTAAQLNACIERAVHDGVGYTLELHGRVAEGNSPRWFQMMCKPVVDSNGKLIRLVGTQMDITERKRANEENEKLASIVENSEDVILSRTLNGIITSWNHGAEKMYGYSAQEVVGAPMSVITPPEFLAEISQITEKLGRGETVKPFETVRVTKSGRRLNVSVSASPIRGADGEIIGVSAIARDITERKRTEQYLKESSEQLRALSARLETAREEEGKRIARELHDVLGGAMTGLRWDLQSVCQSLSNIDMEAGARAHIRNKIETMNGLIDSSIETVRRISSELRPAVLDDLGLAAAIKWQAQEFESRTGITCMCHSLSEVEGMRRDRDMAVYRILQEALTNVLRHAQATRIDLFMSSNDGELILEIRDNGIGISEEESVITGSLGLLGMRERAQLVGGKLSITGTRDKGTTVIVRVPLDLAWARAG